MCSDALFANFWHFFKSYQGSLPVCQLEYAVLYKGQKVINIDFN